MWICEVCNNKNFKNGFNQKDFVNHLRIYHLTKCNNSQGIPFQCNYGENGICFYISNNEKILSEFHTEKEYGQHLIKTHLKSYKITEENQFKISDNVYKENSQNYQNIINPTNNSVKKWNPYHSVVNLPAVLNDPNNRQLDVFSKTWGESFEKSEVPPCSHLVAPCRDAFKDYIIQVRGSLKYREKMLKKINDNKNLEGSTPVGSNQKLNLENVPKLFFQCDFNLNSKDIFSSVIPIFHSVSGAMSPTGSSNFTLLDNTTFNKFCNSNGRSKNHKWLTDAAAKRMNDKLSYYLDIVEINIAKQVSKKSNSFFEAVSTHDKVQEKLKSALSQISVVRTKLQSADEKLTKHHLYVLKLNQKKINLQLLSEKLTMVKTVHSTQGVIQTLLASNDFCGALDLIAGIMEFELFSKSSQTSPILCLRHVHAQLVEMRKFVEKMVQQEYVNAISYQLRLDNELSMTNNEIMIDYQLVPNLLAMIRIVLYAPPLPSNSNEFVQLYFYEAMEVLKTIVKSRVVQAFSKSHQTLEQISLTTSLDEGTPGSLADQMRALEFEQWMELMTSVSLDMLQLLDKVRIGVYTMSETILTHINKSGIVYDSQHIIPTVQSEETITNQLRTVTISEIEALTGKIVEAIQQRMTKLIRARAKNRYFERFLPAQMVQLNKFLQDLSNQIVLRLGERSIGSNFMISSIHSYASNLANRFHNEHREKLLLILDSDLWRAAEVPSQLQELAKHISQQSGLSLLDKNGLNSVPTSQLSHQFLQLDHNRFTVAAAALMLFQMIVEYCQCAIDLSQIQNIPELLFSHLISLLETFNSRSCQLVLGAKARQLVELETITARNLALSARSLQLVLALIPRIIVQFSSLAVIKPSLLSQLSDVERIYHDHIDNINNKLISLMEDRIKSRMLTWNGKPPSPSSETRTICQHLSKLHDAICDVYQIQGETELFLKIHNIFKTHLRARMRELNIAMDNGPQHGIVKLELAFYMSQLTGFCGLKKFTDKFTDIWK